MSDRIKVLVVDDSALVRKVITDILASDPMIEVVGTANNGKSAIFKTSQLNPDVITMDIEMPILDGLEALKYIIQTNPKPVIMMSVLTQHGADATFRALELGAVDFIPKPSSVVALSVDEIADLLIMKVKSVYRSKVNIPTPGRVTAAETLTADITPPAQVVAPLPSGKTSSDKIVAVGTSTGGPSALLSVFREIPPGFPSPVVVVQHMPEGFTKAFAERLNSSSHLTVKEAEDGDRMKPGCGFIAPGHSHIIIEKRNGEPVIRLSKSDKVSGHRPSIDVLFNSVADVYHDKIVAVIMTGMGRDGADGISRIRSLGGHTIAQNEETSVVYGMNRVAVEIGGINDVVPLDDIPRTIIKHL